MGPVTFLRFWSLLTWEHQTVAAYLWCKAPVPRHPKLALLDWDLVAVEFIWTHRYVQENSMRWSELGAAIEDQNALVIKGWTWLTTILRLWHLSNAQLSKCPPPKYPPHYNTTTNQWSMLACCLHQILTLPSKRKSGDLSDQETTLFSVIQFFLALKTVASVFCS